MCFLYVQLELMTTEVNMFFLNLSEMLMLYHSSFLTIYLYSNFPSLKQLFTKTVHYN